MPKGCQNDSGKTLQQEGPPDIRFLRQQRSIGHVSPKVNPPVHQMRRSASYFMLITLQPFFFASS
jgi:hypothetical protein